MAVATLLLIPLADAAAATSSSPDPSVTRPADLVAGILERLPFGEDTLEQLRRDRAQRRTCGCDVVYPVNDLDGDGRADIAAITIHESSDGSSRSTIDVISSRRRAKSLFTAPVVVPGYAVVIPTHVGGVPALLYYALDYRYFAGSYEGRLQTGALGSGGSRLWERSWELPWTWATVRYQRWLEDLAFITDKDGIAVGFALAISESLSPPGFVKLRLEQVSAADGETVAERTTSEVDDLESVTLTPLALKGKTHDALAVQVSPIGGKESLRVHSSLDEEALWEVKVKHYAWVEAVANVIGGAHNELLLSQGWGKRYRLQALDSMTGEVAWEGSTPGQVVDHAGGDGRSDLVQVRQLGRDQRRWRLTRVELPGRVLWSEDVSVRRHHRYANWTSLYVDPWGDVDEDGILEVRAYMTSYQDDGDRLRYLGSERALIDGENGRTLTQASLYLPLIGTLDGRGSDALTLDLREQEVEITGRDGVDGSVLWRQRIAIEAVGKLDPCRWGYYVVEGAGSDDVLVVIPRREGGDEEVLIDGSTGKVIWRLDPAGAV